MILMKDMKEVLQKIMPKEPKKVMGEVKEFMQKIEKQLKMNKLDAKCILGGSFAKDTWLEGDYDVDLFIAFDKKYRGQPISNMLEKALAPWKPIRVHGSRDYFWIKNDITFELIPVLAIKKPTEAENLTDSSPLHVNWVNKNKKYKNEIRLTKKFLKAQKCYGAESFIKGFSGHVTDILVIHYKGFPNFLKNAAKWTPKTIIDPYNKHKGKALFVLNRSKTEGPLVLIDPIDPLRNAAAALSQEKYDLFVKSAKEYLKKQNISFFEEKQPNFDELKKKGKLVIVDVEPLEGKPDVTFTKILHAYEYMTKKLEPFDIITYDWQWKNQPKLWWVLKIEKLPETEKQEGPPTTIKEGVENFKKKHAKTIIQDGRVYAIEKVLLRTPEEVVKSVIEEKYVKDKAKSFRIL